MNNSTAPPKGTRNEMKIMSVSFTAIVIIFTIIGHTLVFKAFHKFPSLRTASNSILVSLSVADSLTAIPFILHISFISLGLGESWASSGFQFLCQSSARISLALISVIILHLALISVERVIAVKFALRYRTIVTYRRATVACLIAWLWGLAATLLFPLALRSDDNERAYERLYQALHPCFKFRPRSGTHPKMPSATRGYFILSVASLLVAPMLTILCSYGYVFAVSRKHRKQIREVSDNQVISTIKHELKGAYTLAIVVGACVLSFTPLLVVASFRFFGLLRVIRKPWLKHAAYNLAFGFNACLNPVIYAWRHEKFKSAFRKLLRCA